jgi:hypothetical protein
MSALCQYRKSAALFDHLVGQRQQVRGHGDAERFRGLEVDHKSVGRGLLKWQGAGRGVRLPGLHVRTNVFCENRPGAPGLPAIEEEHQAHG